MKQKNFLLFVHILRQSKMNRLAEDDDVPF
ncbi:hypothetical protein BH09BAC1_BH09BAC1_11030 [soil metagenome]